jgi:RNA polymerase sigma-70 factor (ECF subfamily)
MRSVVNDAIKASQRGGRLVSLETPTGEGRSLEDALADPKPGPADLFEAAETREDVWQVLSELPPAQRAVIVMRYYLGLSEAEMAEALDAPQGTVKWRLHAARKRLRTLMRPEEGR